MKYIAGSGHIMHAIKVTNHMSTSLLKNMSPSHGNPIEQICHHAINSHKTKTISINLNHEAVIAQ